jgi:hypothetical protein
MASHHPANVFITNNTDEGDGSGRHYRLRDT